MTVPHPRMYDDDDPYLARLRPLALGFPAATEVETFGRPTFRARKMFAIYGGGTKGPAQTRRRYDHGLIVLPDGEEELAALHEDPRAFVPAYYGPFGWVGIDLAGTPPEDVDWQEVAELLDGSYRQVAGPRLVRRLDADGGPAGRGGA
uniref:MmcQ/YjbR family DNA-binding protein n=1 Tax=Georgenia satyanarayanai TaxID=860221 RepID=UPI001D021C47|nr:MmcQ/YjbR family DNA-binding protein [Georgenia satyanarayanai]